MEALVLKKTSTVLQCLASIGLRPEDVDYITYDHLHTQNVSRWLGANGQAPLFPNAKLLVMREEWESAQALIPWQNQWYCPQGTQGIAPERIELLDDSVWLGDGAVALVRTKGHTEGNHSIVAHTEQGLLVTSENGVSLDAYEPKHSKISGLADFAKRTGAENTWWTNIFPWCKKKAWPGQTRSMNVFPMWCRPPRRSLTGCSPVLPLRCDRAILSLDGW
jgi:hypothetical protein